MVARQNGRLDIWTLGRLAGRPLKFVQRAGRDDMHSARCDPVSRTVIVISSTNVESEGRSKENTEGQPVHKGSEGAWQVAENSERDTGVDSAHQGGR